MTRDRGLCEGPCASITAPCRIVRRAGGSTRILFLCVLPMCAPLPEPGADPGEPRGASAVPSDPSPDAADASDLVPTGHGSLRQDDFTVELRSGPLLIKITPLAESVTRLAAPDTYARLHALARSHTKPAARESGEPEPTLFLVSFFSYEPDARYEPESLQLEHRGALLAPQAILPVTPDFGRERLRQQEVRSAVYAFTGEIDLSLPVGVRYELARSDAWERLIPRLESERARVRARAGG